MGNVYAILDRVKAEAEYVIEHKATVRQTAKEFGISKTTVHRDMKELLIHIDTIMYYKVREVMDFNSEQKAIRGGMAKKKKV